MNKIYFIIFFLLTTIFVAGSCSYLNEEIRSSSQKATYYQTEEQIVSGLNGCYMPLRTIYTSNSYFLVTEAQTDLLFKNSKGNIATLEGISPRSPSIGTTIWTNGYLGVMRTNAMSDPLFKKGFQFTAERTGSTLLYIRMRYGDDSLGLSKTFYFDKDLTGIVAFK